MSIRHFNKTYARSYAPFSTNTMLVFLKRRWEWARQNPLFWANIALFFSTILFIRCAGQDDFWLRSWSLFLQIVGAITVWRDLIQGASDFGAAAILQRNWAWLKAGVGIRTVITVGASLTSGSSIAQAVSQVQIAQDAAASVEQRIARLETFTELLSNAQAQTTGLVLATKRELVKEINQVRADLERSVASTNAQLKDAMVGNYPVLLFGAAWVAVGTILSTYAPDITEVVGGAWGFCALPFDSVDYLKLKYWVAR